MKLRTIDTEENFVTLWYDCENPSELMEFTLRLAAVGELLYDYVEIDELRYLAGAQFKSSEAAMLFRLSL